MCIEDEVSCSCLLTSSNSIPVLSPTSLCPSGPSYLLLCPHPRKHPWKASHSALEPRWTTPAHGHPGGTGQYQAIPSCVEAQSLSAPLPLPRFQHGSFARVPRFPESFRPLPKGLADVGGRHLDGERLHIWKSFSSFLSPTSSLTLSFQYYSGWPHPIRQRCSRSSWGLKFFRDLLKKTPKYLLFAKCHKPKI